MQSELRLFFFAENEVSNLVTVASLCRHKNLRGPNQNTKWSPSTSCVGGVFPSAPCDVLRLNKDVATALAVAQAKIAPPPHSPRLFGPSAHEGSLLPTGSRSVWFQWTCDRQPRPQDNKAGPSSRLHQFWVCSLLPAASSLQDHTIHVLCSSVWGPISLESTHNCGVHN